MEEELRCPVCKVFFVNPVLLPCSHSLCLSCALSVQTSTRTNRVEQSNSILTTVHHNIHGQSPTVCLSSPDSGSISSGDAASVFAASEPDSVFEECDRSSLASSETTDSGVMLCINSRPSSLLGGYTLICPACQKNSWLGDEGAQALPRNRALSNVVLRYCSRTTVADLRAPPPPAGGFTCQLCEQQPSKLATVRCEQCSISYCQQCLRDCHPARGPLAKHQLTPLTTAVSKILPTATSTTADIRCSEHSTQSVSLYCMSCKIALCTACVKHQEEDPRHAGHDLQPLSTVCKIQKMAPNPCCLIDRCDEVHVDAGLVGSLSCRAGANCRRNRQRASDLPVNVIAIELGQMVTDGEQRMASVPEESWRLVVAVIDRPTELSQTLQSLSEKAKTATENLARLKQLNDKVQTNSVDFEALIVTQCDKLIVAIEQRKQELLDLALREKETKNQLFRDQISNCTNQLQKTTGLVQFCIEALKEVDPIAFIQISPALIHRVSNMELIWRKELEADIANVSPEFELTLDVQPVTAAINQLNFVQLKIPECPTIITEACSAQNNSVTIVWKAPLNSYIEGYILEIDGGHGDGNFKEVYVGADTACNVDNLHFNSVYLARVKAYNMIGEGSYSQCIRLHTAGSAWFQFKPNGSNCEAVFDQENTTLSSTSLNYSVVLGTVCFTRGRHYWEVSVDRRDASADVIVGIATSKVSRNMMLGKDEHGWSMYIDEERSWYLHAEMHHGRVDGGASVGSVIGILLDCDAQTLDFYVDGRKQTSELAFRNLPRSVFYPAFSVNRNVQITLHSGIEPPDFCNNQESTRRANSCQRKLMKQQNSPTTLTANNRTRIENNSCSSTDKKRGMEIRPQMDGGWTTGLRSLWLSLHEPKRQLAAFFLRQRPTVLLALTNQEKERQCTMDTGVAAGRYAMFICNRPITVFMTTTFLLCTLTALGLELAPTPDFSDPKVGFETRGTVLSDRVLTWNNLEEKISFYPDSRKEFYRQMPPINILQRRKRNGTGQLLEELFFAALTSSPCLQLHAPLAQLEYHSLIVLEAPSTKSLFTVDVILELCKLQQQINATLQEVKIRLEQNHFWSLPNYITCFSGELTCTNLKEKDVGTVAANIERCAPYQQQIIHCKGSANTAACQAIPDYCNSKYYQDLFYFILSQNIFSNATGPVYTSMVLPIYSYNTYEYLGRRDVSLKKFAKLYEKVSEWQNDLKHLKLVGLNLGIKLQMFNSLLVNDTVWVFLGISLVAVIIWIYSGSFFYAVTVLLSMFFSVTVAYFVYGLVFRMEFFPFMNLLVIVLLIGIGADDTFVLKYVFDTSKKQGAKTIAPEDIVDALSYAALSMLITSVTTAAAFFSSLTSNVIVIKCFAVFAGTTMLMNYLLVVSFMPASLIILERYVNPLYERWCPKRLNALVVQAYASGAIASNFLMQICLPFVLQRLRAYVIAAFGLLLALSFFLVFYKPGLSLPKRNPILLFQPSHPFEWYDDQMELHFRFALARYCMPIKVSLVWGFVPSEVGGSHFDPFSYGQLAQDARFKANLETLRDLQAVCDRLAKEPAFNYDGDCFAHAFFKWSKQQVCVGEGESCCAYLSKYFDQRNVQPCVAAFTRTTDVFSGSPIIRYDNDAVVGFVIYLETRHNWTTDYDKLKHFQDDIESTVRRVLGESRTATLKRGWPVTTDSMTTSWYDLQKELLLGTPTSIILSILIAFIVAVCVTRTVVLSFLSILSISAVILDTIAVLVLLGWRLNVVESTIIILTIGLSFDYTLHYAVAYKFASLGSRDDKVMTVLKYIGVPVTLSALTTLLAGLAMLPSNVMAYTQIGFFMILMSLISWLNSSLCYLSLLAVWGPQSTMYKFVKRFAMSKAKRCCITIKKRVAFK
ncbi:Tripartite motif-containing protein 67 [Trichinella patagoniensis]|uniref:Tripartite motif-containing protein 67 n=1 Tax=Trichinella patagoniensis TaxID=990121 RepID=A0A0V0ZWI8_9BILA|nr:Tripartite motif-containing protein 67 [Trichinella patagoniensis]